MDSETRRQYARGVFWLSWLTLALTGGLLLHEPVLGTIGGLVIAVLITLAVTRRSDSR
jgi:hypothetical protein